MWHIFAVETQQVGCGPPRRENARASLLLTVYQQL